jgi:hypothetical protein
MTKAHIFTIQGRGQGSPEWGDAHERRVGAPPNFREI